MPLPYSVVSFFREKKTPPSNKPLHSSFLVIDYTDQFSKHMTSMHRIDNFLEDVAKRQCGNSFGSRHDGVRVLHPKAMIVEQIGAATVSSEKIHLKGKDLNRPVFRYTAVFDLCQADLEKIVSELNVPVKYELIDKWTGQFGNVDYTPDIIDKLKSHLLSLQIDVLNHQTGNWHHLKTVNPESKLSRLCIKC